MVVFLSYRKRSVNAISTCFTARDAAARYDELMQHGAVVTAICDEGRQITVTELRAQIIPAHIPRVPPA